MSSHDSGISHHADLTAGGHELIFAEDELEGSLPGTYVADALGRTNILGRDVNDPNFPFSGCAAAAAIKRPMIIGLTMYEGR